MLLHRRLLAIFAGLGLLLVSGLSARAQNLETALAGFTTDSFDDTDAAIAAVAATNDARAETVIRALQDGRLSFSAQLKKVYLREAGSSRGWLPDSEAQVRGRQHRPL
jgi:urea transport system permease protein